MRDDVKRRVIFHVDMDAFFVSVEEILNPALRGKPVIVGGGAASRGVVAAASYKAREYGVRSAMPMVTAKRLCPKGIFLRGTHGAYAEYSRRVMDVLRRFTPDVEVVSVDEAYLDLTGCLRVHGVGPLAIAQRIRDTIMGETSLPASIGVASSKLVAKIASKMSKPNGILLILPGHEAEFLAPLPVGAMPGIGPSSAESLNRLGIRRMGDLARISPEELERVFGRVGRSMAARARGEDGRAVTAEPDDARSIGKETTFAVDVSDVPILDATLSYLCEKVGARLRRDDFLFRRVTLKLRHADFATYTRAAMINGPSRDTAVIFREAKKLLRGLLAGPWRVRLIGVSVSALCAPERQMSLFDSGSPSASQRLWAGVDEARGRFGFDSVLLARSYIHAAAAERRRRTAR